MPIYEYECTSCCKVVEVIQRMTENPLTNCPDCSGPVKKLVSRSSFQLKGGGWYSDGYSSKSSNGSGAAPKDKAIESTSDKATKSTSPKAEKTTSSPSDSSSTKSKADCSVPA